MLPLDETVKKTNSLKIKGEHYYAAKAKTGNRKEGKALSRFMRKNVCRARLNEVSRQ